MPNWYEEMKPHMPLNKTIRFVCQGLVKCMNLSETRQRNRVWVSARETQTGSTSKCECEKSRGIRKPSWFHLFLIPHLASGMFTLSCLTDCSKKRLWCHRNSKQTFYYYVSVIIPFCQPVFSPTAQLTSSVLKPGQILMKEIKELSSLEAAENATLV